MKKMVNGILKQYGTGMELTGASGTVTVKGFLQPVRSKSVQNMVSQDTPLGEVSRGQYVYIGPADVAVQEGDTLQVEQMQYLFRRVERFCVGEDAIYLWGLCVGKGGIDAWGKTS